MSTFNRYFFKISFCFTPNLCSSSITNKPRSLNSKLSWSILCVPIQISNLPDFNNFFVSLISLFPLSLFKHPMFTGNWLSLDLKVSKCCSAKIVVGTKIATCLPLWIALKLALIASSVFPKPTSPQSNLSIGELFSISA